MNAQALQTWIPLVVIVGGAVWGIMRLELNRYASSHPNAPVVKDAEALIAEAKAVAPILGVTAPKVAGFLAGFLAHAGHPVSAKVILAGEQAIAEVAKADAAAVQTIPRISLPAPAVVAPTVAAPAPADPAPPTQ